MKMKKVPFISNMSNQKGEGAMPRLEFWIEEAQHCCASYELGLDAEVKELDGDDECQKA